MKSFGRLFAAAVVLAVSQVASASIVENGTFENPDINAVFVTVTPGSPVQIDDWTVTGNVDIVSASANLNPTLAYDGDQSIDLAGSPGPGSISQVLSTVSGQAYELKFAVSSNVGPYDDRLFVTWGGAAVGGGPLDTPAQGTWKVYTFTVLASSASTTLSFATDIVGFAGPLLDGVTVEPISSVPEPATLTIWGLGAIGCAVAAYRRKRLGA